MEKQQNQQKKINIELDDKTSFGEYANLAIVTHSPSEFVMDFIGMLPGMPKAKVKSRIIMAPQHVKSLMKVLQDNVRKYEAKFGEIKMPKQTAFQNMGFKGPDEPLPN